MRSPRLCVHLDFHAFAISLCRVLRGFLSGSPAHLRQGLLPGLASGQLAVAGLPREQGDRSPVPEADVR